MNKILKIWIASFLLGQATALFYKNKNFREKFNKVNWFDKCKVLFDELLDLNKNIFFDLKEVDYKNEYETVKFKLEEKFKDIENKYNQLKEELKEIWQEKVKPKLEELQEKVLVLKAEINKLNSKYDISNKIENILSKLRKDLQE